MVNSETCEPQEHDKIMVFQTVCRYFTGEINWTVEESHHAIEALSVLVAAKEVDRK